LVMKTATKNPRSGNAAPRICETSSGLINSIGLENPGILAYAREELDKWKKFSLPVIANISGESVEEYATNASAVASRGVSAIEVNISCRTLKKEAWHSD